MKRKEVIASVGCPGLKSAALCSVVGQLQVSVGVGDGGSSPIALSVLRSS